MADDHSEVAVGAYNSFLKKYVQTPNIDKLAKEGALLTNCVCTNSLCAPSRASILTGKYSHKSGVYTLRECLDTKTMQTLPVVMKKGGYQTAVVGKWHINGDNLYGFDFYAVTHSQGAYINPAYATKEGKIHKEGHSSNAITDISLEWLKNRKKDKPFMLMTHFKSVHGPWQFAERFKEMYQNQTIPEPPNLFDAYKNRSPQGVPKKSGRIFQPNNNNSLVARFSGNKKGKKVDWATGNFDFSGMTDEEKTKAAYQKYIKDYLRCVKGIDEGVGRLIEYLEQNGLLENTVIIYTSDQGMYLGEHGFYDKRLGLEEALKMPFIIRYPKKIKPGQIINELVNNVDYPETIIDFAGLEIPEEMQGFSFKPILTGENTNPIREASFYQFYSNGCPLHFGVRTKDYKLLKYVGKDGKVSGIDLYDLKKDKWEMINQAHNPDYKEVLAYMEKQLTKEIETIGIKPYQMPGQSGWKNEVKYLSKEKSKKPKKKK
ncbi:MAG: sulfatase [Prolixibacteraceae bacterium]|nr:sulfatase [Prolixibacteraceae bacterium]